MSLHLLGDCSYMGRFEKIYCSLPNTEDMNIFTYGTTAKTLWILHTKTQPYTTYLYLNWIFQKSYLYIVSKFWCNYALGLESLRTEHLKRSLNWVVVFIRTIDGVVNFRKVFISYSHNIIIFNYSKMCVSAPRIICIVEFYQTDRNFIFDGTFGEIFRVEPF